MHKIDKETRTRFEDTFNKINAGLQEKFPRLFGGGHAYLELVGEAGTFYYELGYIDENGFDMFYVARGNQLFFNRIKVPA